MSNLMPIVRSVAAAPVVRVGRALALAAATLGAVVVLSAVPSSVTAQTLPSDIVRAEIIPGWRLQDGTQMAALRLTLAKGWKTYWRAPGEAGIPPSFDWTGSLNVGAVAFHWPQPSVFDVNGFRVIGYDRELVLPFSVTPVRPGDPVKVAAEVELGVCDTVCVPVTLDFAADLPSGGRPDPAIRAALDRAPTEARTAGLRAATCSAEPIRDGLRLTATLTIPPTGADEFAVIELRDPSVWVSPPDVTRDGDRLVAVADLVPSNAQPFALNRSDIRVTLFGGDRVVEVRGCTG